MGFELNKGGNFTLCPAGNYIGRCFMLIDLGTHRETFQGKVVGDKRKLRFGFEFPSEKHVFDEKKGPEPFTLSIKLTNSLHEKANLAPFLTSWRGAPVGPDFDIRQVILCGKTSISDPTWTGGAAAMVNVIHKKKSDGGMTAVIQAVAKLPKGIVCEPPIMPVVLYSIDQGPNDPTFKALPQWIRDECAQCLEWAGKPQQDDGPAQTHAESEVESGGGEGENNPF